MKISGTNLAMIRGDTESIAVTCSKEGVNYFEAGDTVYLTVKKSYSTDAKVLQKVQTVFTPEGVAIFDIDPADTKGIGFGNYAYDIQLTKLSGEVTTLVEHSILTILPEVTYE